MGQEILNRKHFFSKTSSLTFVHMHVTSKPWGIHSTKIDKFETKESKDIEWTSLGQTNQRIELQCKAIYPLFSKRSLKMRSYEEHADIAFFVGVGNIMSNLLGL